MRITSDIESHRKFSKKQDHTTQREIDVIDAYEIFSTSFASLNCRL
jgi:uncharacterized protein YfbU (UPF0304 family)